MDLQSNFNLLLCPDLEVLGLKTTHVSDSHGCGKLRIFRNVDSNKHFDNIDSDCYKLCERLWRIHCLDFGMALLFHDSMHRSRSHGHFDTSDVLSSEAFPTVEQGV